MFIIILINVLSLNVNVLLYGYCIIQHNYFHNISYMIMTPNVIQIYSLCIIIEHIFIISYLLRYSFGNEYIFYIYSLEY